jgi:hypothetical protein
MATAPGNPSIGKRCGLHEKGYVTEPVRKAKSVLFTKQGLRESKRLFEVVRSSLESVTTVTVGRLRRYGWH